MSGQECGHGLSLSSAYLARLKKGTRQVNGFFAPSVYYEGKSTKFISPSQTTLTSDWLCVDGATTSTYKIELYDDGTHGDDVANDGIFTRDCVYICTSRVNFSDFFGFAMTADINSATLAVMDASKKGTVPYEVITTDLTPHGKAIASSHAFFFADTEGKYYPDLPTSVTPNSAIDPNAKNVAVSALIQVFGDVFDYVTVTTMERTFAGIDGAGMYRWQDWDRRGGPDWDGNIGRPGNCISTVAGIPIQRLKGLINSGDIVSGGGAKFLMHELEHGISGFEYHMALEAARNGDNMHVPGACTDAHSSLQGPVWDWVKGAPEAIPDSTGGIGEGQGGVRLVENNDCASCSEDNLPNCCTFRYADMPITHAAMIENPELIVMSPLMLYIAGMIKASEIAPADKTYYCMGSNTDGGCGSHPGQTPCITKVDDSDRSRVTSDIVSRFTFDQLVNAVGGERYPAKKLNVVRHAAVHLSAREPTESEITFYTLLWRQHEIQKTPWKRFPYWANTSERYPIQTWYFHTSGNSILHSRLHGIDCGDNGEAVPSCSTRPDVCAGAPCGPGAVCKDLDGQPLCTCRDGLVGDGYECAFPSETDFGALPTAHKSGSWCFPITFRWTDFVNEASLPPYPGGQMPYASTTCHNHGVCPADWRCHKTKGCLQPTGISICQEKGFSRGQCEALGCCTWNAGLSGDKCVKQSDGVCKKPVDPKWKECDDQETCLFLQNLRPQDGSLIKKTCGWLANRKTSQKRNICTKPKFSLATQGYKPARDACADICDSFM